jgi:pterin-4a-carbinolamine dehydratase
VLTAYGRSERQTWRNRNDDGRTSWTAKAGRRWPLLAERGWTWSRAATPSRRRFVFGDFNEAFGWMTRIAMVAEQ